MHGIIIFIIIMMLASQTLIIWQVRTIHVVIVFSDLMVDNVHAPMTVCTYYLVSIDRFSH